MGMPAFYVPRTEWKAKPVLTGDEARHAQVLRLRPGEEVLIMDGHGASGLCKIITSTRRAVELELVREWRAEMPGVRAVLALALSKAVRRGFFLEKAAELGAWEVWLWEARRSQGHLDDKLIRSCESQLRAGAKQCHNPWFPALKVCKDASAVAEAAKTAQWRLMPWEVKSANAVIPESWLAREGTTLFVIGPEGGITEEEAGIFRKADFEFVSLGERVLRCETAAVLCLGLHWWAARENAAVASAP